MAALALLIGTGCAGPSPAPRTPESTRGVDLAKAGAKSAPANVQDAATAIPVEADDPVWGAPDAPVTLVAFLDFQCPYCAHAEATIAALERAYGPDKLRVVFKHCPLPMHPDAVPAALSAQAVHDLAGSDTFFAFARALFDSQRSLGESNLVRMAEAVGVERGMFLRAARSGRVAREVARDLSLASRLGVDGTPAFRINGVALVGAQPAEEFRRIIDGELSEARALTARGVRAQDVYAKRVAANLADAPPASAQPDAAPGPDTTVYKVPVGSSPALGPASAPITIVEFADFQCPYCQRADKTVRELLKRYPDKIRLVFKHTPLPFHTRALPAAMLAMEARKERGDRGFWDVHDRLFDSQPNLADADLEDIAKKAHLDVARVKTAIAKQAYASSIEDDLDLADDVGVDATPTFFINGRKLEGARGIDDFVRLVDEELPKAEALAKQPGVGPEHVYAMIMKGAKTPGAPETRSVPAPTHGNPTYGPPRAPVVVQLFSDFQCPYCKRVLPTLDALEKEFPGKIRLVWRNLPLPFHEHAREAAGAAMEAYAQAGDKGFWKMHDLIYENQSAPDGLTRAALDGYAKLLKLDVARFDRALDSGAHDAELEKDVAVANAAGIDGTPAFVINGYYVSGAQPLSKFRKIVERALVDLQRRRP